MSKEPNDVSSGSSLSADEMAHARNALEEGDAAVVAGPAGDVILLSEGAAEELAGALGRFGDALTVRIFAAVTLADLGIADIAAAAGADEATVAEQIVRLESGGFVVHLDSDGSRLYAAGNPPLKRFFAKRFASGRRFHP